MTKDEHSNRCHNYHLKYLKHSKTYTLCTRDCNGHPCTDLPLTTNYFYSSSGQQVVMMLLVARPLLCFVLAKGNWCFKSHARTNWLNLLDNNIITTCRPPPDSVQQGNGLVIQQPWGQEQRWFSKHWQIWFVLCSAFWRGLPESNSSTSVATKASLHISTLGDISGSHGGQWEDVF